MHTHIHTVYKRKQVEPAGSTKLSRETVNKNK